MSFNFSGIIISENIHQKMEVLQAATNWKYDFIKEITFEEACANWKSKNISDCYFGSNFSIFFIEFERCLNPVLLPELDTLTFTISETSMAFSFHYSEKGVLKRSRMDVEGETVSEYGEKIPIEYEISDMTQLIWRLMEMVMGTNWNFDFSEKAYRFQISPISKIKIPEVAPEVKSTIPTKKLPKKNLLVYNILFQYSRYAALIGIILTLLAIFNFLSLWWGVTLIISGFITKSLSHRFSGEDTDRQT